MMMISVFALLSFIAICTVLILQYNFNQNVTKKIANDQFRILAKDINKDLNQLNRTYENFIAIYTSFLKDKTIEDIFANKEQFIKIYADFLRRNKNIYALYLGTSKEAFFNLRKIQKATTTPNEHDVKSGNMWLTREVKTDIETRVYYDKNFQITSSKALKTTYKPTQRPWYQDAISQKGKIIRTEPYKFDLFDEYGITYSKEYQNGNVFGMDILLEDMDAILENRLILKTQKSCIIDKDLNLIAKVKLLDMQHIKEIFAFYQKGKEEGVGTIEGTKYIYQVKPYGQDFLVSYANFDTLMKPYKKELEKNIIFALVIVLILSFLVWILASLLMRPIIALSRENEKLALREYDNIKQVDSCIYEISELSSSIIKMSKTIKEHHEELEHLSSTDTLTKIYNRAKLEKIMEEKMHDFMRYGHKFGIIMVDIDNFKKVNDSYGHQVGDQFLIEFANILQSNIRSSDKVGRWGGEEFIIICKETDIKSLEKLAYKLKNSIQCHNFKNVMSRTASFGIAQYQAREKISELMSRADKALYRAKNSGRNRVMVG